MRRIFLLLVILGLLLTACTADKSVEKDDIQTTNGDKEATSTHEETQPTDTLYLEENNYYYINKLLDQQTNIYSVKWSVSNDKVAFVEGNPELQTGQLYLWKANENKPKKVAGIADWICEIYWSPDGKYFFVDIGTSAQSVGKVVSTKKLDVVESFTYVGNPSWSRDASKIALGKVTEIDKEILWEVNGTIDLAVYDVNNKELKVIMQGNENEYYLPLDIKWSPHSKYLFVGVGGSELGSS